MKPPEGRPIKYRYAQTDQIVFGRRDFDAQIEMLTEIKTANNDSRSIEVRIECGDHKGAGTIAMYEDGLIVLACVECGHFIGQAEVSTTPRPWGITSGIFH